MDDKTQKAVNAFIKSVQARGQRESDVFDAEQKLSRVKRCLDIANRVVEAAMSDLQTVTIRSSKSDEKKQDRKVLPSECQPQARR